MNRCIDFPGFSLSIQQQPQLGLGGSVWDAALVLSSVLVQTPLIQTIQQSSSLSLQGLSVCELGSGTGLCGLVAWLLKAEVLLTDLSLWLPLLEQNIANHQQLGDPLDPPCRCAALQWGNEADVVNLPIQPPFNLILASDLIYEPNSYSQLIQTLERLSDQQTIILMSYEKRKSREREFWLLLSCSFEWKFLSPQEFIPEDYRCEEIGVFWIQRKQTNNNNNNNNNNTDNHLSPNSLNNNSRKDATALSLSALLDEPFFATYPHENKYLTREEETAAKQREK